MLEAPIMPVRIRLDDLLGERTPPISQSELARASKISLVTVNAIANNRTAQVKLATVDRLCRALSKLLGRTVEPGELLERSK